MLSYPEAPSEGRSGCAVSAGLAVVVTGVVFASIGRYMKVPPGPSPGLVVATAGTAIVMACGVALAALIRSAASTPASVGEWTRRTLAGALLLTPAALLATQPFLADGWSFATCGTLVAPNRAAGSDFTEFRLACDAAASDRFLQTAIVAAAGCLVMVGYGLGLWLRRRLRRLRGDVSSTRVE